MFAYSCLNIAFTINLVLYTEQMLVVVFSVLQLQKQIE